MLCHDKSLTDSHIRLFCLVVCGLVLYAVSAPGLMKPVAVCEPYEIFEKPDTDDAGNESTHYLLSSHSRKERNAQLFHPNPPLFSLLFVIFFVAMIFRLKLVCLNPSIGPPFSS